jgi:hypothetical protein
MDNCVCDEFAFGSELDPLDSRGSTFWTDLSWRDHDVFAADAPDGHEFAIRDLAIKLLDCGRRRLAQFSSTPQYVNDAGGAGSA